MARIFALTLLALLGCAAAGRSAEAGANPIRKVVTMMQNMQKEIAETGAKEKELFDKFMCYCKNAGGDLSKSISENEAKASELPSQVEESEASLVQLKEDL